MRISSGVSSRGIISQYATICGKNPRNKRPGPRCAQNTFQPGTTRLFVQVKPSFHCLSFLSNEIAFAEIGHFSMINAPAAFKTKPTIDSNDADMVLAPGYRKI